MVDISIPRPDFEKDRGQVGIETLVVFIAMILVAALAAGVLINTAGFLQNKATSTSHDSQSQVSDRVTVISATGTVDGNNNVTSINISVMPAPGASEIDLEGATIQWIGPAGAETLIYNQSGASAANGYFNVTAEKDNDNSVPVLNAREDRFQIALELNTSVEVLKELQGGEEATVHIVTASGTRTTYVLNVPQSLSSASQGEAVSL